MRGRLWMLEAMGMTEGQARGQWDVFALLGRAAGVTKEEAAEATLRLWGHMIARGRCRHGEPREVDGGEGGMGAL